MIDAHLPNPGTPTQPVEAGYMANAYVRMRHPDYDALRGMLDDVGRTVARARRVSSRQVTLLGPAAPADPAAGRPRTSTRTRWSPSSPRAGRSARPTTPSCDALLGHGR